jgi:polar amino acid transport system substrate-binding protein
MVPLTEEEMPLLCQTLRFDCSQLERVLTLHEMTTGLYMAYSKSTPADLVQRTKAAFDKLQAAGEVRRLMAAQASR